MKTISLRLDIGDTARSGLDLGRIEFGGCKVNKVSRQEADQSEQNQLIGVHEADFLSCYELPNQSFPAVSLVQHSKDKV